MASQPEIIQYDVGVYQLEVTDPVDGGVGAVSNAPLLNLSNRTAYLKKHVDDLESGVTIPPTMAPKNSPALTGTPTAPTPPLGDNTTKLATTAFVQGTVNGVTTKDVSGNTNVTLSTIEAGAGILVFTGILADNIAVIVPATAKSWIVFNQTTGAYTLTVKTAAGAGVAVTQGRCTPLWCDVTNVNDSKTDFPSPALTGTPTTPTPSAGDSTQKIASTSWVNGAVAGIAVVDVAGGSNVTLTQNQWGQGIIVLTGALIANINLIVPNASDQWIIANNTTGAFTVTVKTATGTGVVVTQTQSQVVYCDGTNVFQASAAAGTTSFSYSRVIATASQTSFNLIYTVGNLLVFKNGALLDPEADYTASNGTTVVLNNPCTVGDEIVFYAFASFIVPNAYKKSDIDVMYSYVRKPTIISPTNLSTIVGRSPLLQGNNYYSMYGLAQAGAQFQISTSAEFDTTVYDSGTLGPVIAGQVPGGVLSASTAYYARCRYQDIESVWSAWSDGVQFTTGTESVTTPSITAPANGATNIGDGTTITSSAFSMASGSDTQASSDWEIWTGSGGTGTLVFSSYNDATNMTSIVVPPGTFAAGTTYYPRVRYNSMTSGPSSWSTVVSFSTAASFAPSTAGAAYGGGYFVGQIVISGATYNLIVSPLASGGGALLPISTLSTILSGAQSINDGKANTDAMIAAGASNYPAANFCHGLSIGGFTDWYLPSRDELELLYRNLKPSAAANMTGSRSDGGQQGQNANSIPTGAAYTSTVPAQTSAALFQTGGSEATIASKPYSASTYMADSNVWTQNFSNVNGQAGLQQAGSAKINGNVRAVRRVLA